MSLHTLLLPFLSLAHLNIWRKKSALMQDWPVELVNLVLAELRDEELSADIFDSASISTVDMYLDPDIFADPTKAPSNIACLALSCQRLRALAQPLLFETVYLDSENESRAERLQDLLGTNPHLLSSTRHLVLGKFSIDNELDLGPDDGFTISSGVAQSLPFFRNLSSLRMSGLSIRSAAVTTSLASIGYLQELYVDACSVQSVAILVALINVFHALTKLVLHFDIEYRSKNGKDDTSNQGIPPQGIVIPPGPCLAESHLESLELRPIGQLTISTQRLCEALIKTGRFRSLRSLHLDILGRATVAAINELVGQAAQTLKSLTLNCDDHPGGVDFPELSSLTQLRHLHLRTAGPTAFDTVADLLMTFPTSRCPQEITLDLRFNYSSLDSNVAAPIWKAIENLERCNRFILNLSFSRSFDSAEILSTDGEVRAFIPRTDSRRAVDITVQTQYLEPEESEDDYSCSLFD